MGFEILPSQKKRLKLQMLCFRQIKRKDKRKRIIYMKKTDEYYNKILKEKETTYIEGNFEYITKERNGEVTKAIKSKKFNGPSVRIDSNDTFSVNLKASLKSFDDIDEMIKNLESLKSIMKEAGLKDASDPEIKEIINKEEKDKEMLNKYLKEKGITNPVTEGIYLADLMEYRSGHCKKPDWLTWD